MAVQGGCTQGGVTSGTVLGLLDQLALVGLGLLDQLALVDLDS